MFAGFLVFPGHASAVANNYQVPCFPQDNPDFAYGQYISGWGYHVGADICHAAGTPVYAVADGIVVYSAKTPDSYRWGNLIIIQHQNPDGAYITSLYGHLASNRAVSVGQNVGRGQYIGMVGPGWTADNGNWDPHLHFGLAPRAYGASAGTYATWVKGYVGSMPSGWENSLDFVNMRRLALEQQPAGTWGGGAMYQSGSNQVVFFVDNAGSETWYKEGGSPNPVRMASIGPRDRGSGFYTAGQGWVNPSRIELSATTAPGQRAAFIATFTSPGTPGRYSECFSVIKEGVAWLPEKPLCVTIDVLPPSYRGQVTRTLITSNSDPANFSNPIDGEAFTPGSKRNAKFVVKNTGELPWAVTGPNAVNLGTAAPLDRRSALATIGDGTIAASENWNYAWRASSIDGKYDPQIGTVTPASQILSGESAVFSFTATGPQNAGLYQERFNLVAEGQTWFPDIGANVSFRVPDSGYHFSYVSQSSTPVIGGYDLTLNLRNIGQTPWPVGGAVRLGTDVPRDNRSPFYTSSGTGSWLSPERPATIASNVTNPGKTTVDSGETASFTFRATVPSWVSVGTYRMYVAPVAEGVTWFPEYYGMFFPLNVTTPAWDYQVMAQQFSGDRTNFISGTQMTVSLAVKNTGRQVWPVNGANAVKLGTSRPRDRSSTFYTAAGGDPWSAPWRASSIDGRVTNLSTLATTAATQINPGETALFSVPVTAPTPGTYTEYFNLVAEGQAWFPDYGIFFPFNVR